MHIGKGHIRAISHIEFRQNYGVQPCFSKKNGPSFLEYVEYYEYLNILLMSHIHKHINWVRLVLCSNFWVHHNLKYLRPYAPWNFQGSENECLSLSPFSFSRAWKDVAMCFSIFLSWIAEDCKSHYQKYICSFFIKNLWIRKSIVWKPIFIWFIIQRLRFHWKLLLHTLKVHMQQ